tara:strand:+ start:2915 stop:4024 length:1110 start_codon:yes stop_codon:yes gene_type:complete
MKVLFCLRHNFNSSPGGAQVQILKTKEYLEKLGVTCDITVSPLGVNYNDYDILHLTDLTWVYDNLFYLKEIEKQNFSGKRFLSTIYWPFDDYALNGAPYFQKLIFKIFGINGFEFTKALGKYFFKRNNVYLEGIKSKYIENQKKIVRAVDWLLPNAETEMQALNGRLDLKNKNYSVANNAIDTIMFDEVLSKNSITKNNNLITFVARIDPRKNQLRFLQAMINTKFLIRFIGNPGPNSAGYLKKLKALAETRGNVEFISHITQREVFEHMLEAKLNVLTSWVETPGLVSLEAVYAKCNILVSKKGSVVDYFKDYAFYCAPDNIEEIKKQTINAMNTDFNESFRDLIKTEYAWQVTAAQTLAAYKMVLNE